MKKQSKALGTAYIDRRLDDLGEQTFGELSNAFDQALAACRHELVSKALQLAGHVAHVRIVGRALAAALLAPFTHLEVTQGASPALRIDAWDQQATGIGCSVVPAGSALTGIGIVVRSAKRRYFHLERSHSSMWLNDPESHIMAWFAAASSLTIEERSKPFYRVLFPWLARHRIKMIHAGLIARHGRGALVAGKGGVGKSTSVLSCLAAGFECLGDDYVGLAESGDATFTGFTLFSSCCIHRENMRRFPDLRSLVSEPNYPEEEKLMLVLADRFRDSFVASVPISVILLPRMSGNRATSIRPASRVEALMSIAPSSLLLMPEATSDAFGLIARLVDLVPAYWLELGGSRDEIQAAIKPLMDQLAEG
jgi:hypothetical protein